MEHVNRMKGVLEARKLADHILTSSTDIFADPERNIENLRSALTFEKQRLSDRGYRYLCREIGYLLPHNRNMRVIMRENPEELRGTRLASRILQDNTGQVSQAIENSRGFAVQPEEKETIKQLVDGTHLSEIPSATISPVTITAAMELYPLDTLRWMKAHKPEQVDKRFVEALGRHTVYGINAYDIEQFAPDDIRKELPKDLQNSYTKGLKEAQFKTSMNVGRLQETYAKRPLPTQADEDRRKRHAVNQNAAPMQEAMQAQDPALQNLLAFSAQASQAYTNQFTTTKREYEYNLQGPAPSMHTVEGVRKHAQFMRADGVQMIRNNPGQLRLRKFYPNPNGYQNIYETHVFPEQKQLVQKASHVPYKLGKKFSSNVTKNPEANENVGVDCSGFSAWNLGIFFEQMNKWSMKKYGVKIYPDAIVNQFSTTQLTSQRIMDICSKTKINGRTPRIFAEHKIPTHEELRKSPYNMMVLQLPKPDNKKYGHVVVLARDPKTNNFLVYESAGKGAGIRQFDQWRAFEISRGRGNYMSLGVEELVDEKAVAHIKKMQAQEMQQEMQQGPIFRQEQPEYVHNQEEAQEFRMI